MKKTAGSFVKYSILSLFLIFFSGEPVFSFNNFSFMDEVTSQLKENVDDVKKKSLEEKNRNAKPAATATSMSDGSVKIEVQKPTFFSKVNPEIIKNIEKGSPASIRLAVQSIKKGENGYTDAEKVLFYIASEFFKTVWPSEKITWEVPEITVENPYTGAIATVNKGAFDSSTGNKDFLASLLPSLVMFNKVAGSSVVDQCENALLLALTKNEDSVIANYMLGNVYDKKNDPVQALTHFEKAYKADVPAYELVLAYAKSLRVNGRLADAAEVIASISGDSNDIEVLKQNAYLAFDQKDLDAAEEYVARVLQKNPNELDFVLFRAKILAAKNDFIHAVSLLDVYARQNTTSLDYLLLRSHIQLEWSKNATAASENIENALRLYPDNVDALLMAAKISSTTDAPVAGKYADELAGQVLKVQPNNIEAMHYALDGLVQHSSWKEAYELSSALIRTTEINSSVVENHVQICINMDKKNEAFEFASAMLEQRPDDEIIRQAYILAYCKTGNRDTVIKYLDAQIASDAVSAKMKSYIYYRRSFLQYSEEKQLADLRSSLMSNPRNSDALFRLYEIYYAKADYRKAQYYLRQVVAINPNDSSAKQLNESLTKLIK